MDPEPINPFAVPPLLSQPMRPLQPLHQETDRDYYVDLAGTPGEFERFTHAMANLRAELDQGRLILVTGDTGSGKTSLLNRCADWLVRELEARHGFTCPVIDLTRVLDPDEVLPVEVRIGSVCEQLLDRLRTGNAVPAYTLNDLRRPPVDAGRIYYALGSALRDRHALIILLPDVNDLEKEVISYARFAPPRMFFFVESDRLTPVQVQKIVRRVEAWTNPVTLAVGQIEAADVIRFAQDRLRRHATLGRYPRMSDETLSWVGERMLSVAAAQRCFYQSYQERLDRGLRYASSDWVTIKDISDYLNGHDGTDPGAA